MRTIFFALSFSILSSAMGADLILRENERVELPHIQFSGNGDSGPTSKKYVANIGKLTLNNNSVLFLPEIPGDELTINVDELVVNGRAVIVQTFSRNFDFYHLKKEIFNLYINGSFPAAAMGQNGLPIDPIIRGNDGLKGLRGNDGENGHYGRNSIAKLILNVKISRLSQLYVLLIAESGGAGGKGGKGQNGGGAKCGGEHGGDGGNGGNGGMGGAPGNAGSVVVNWASDSNLKLIGKHPMGLFVKTIPGMVGFPANGGDGGDGGEGKGCFPYPAKRSAGDPGTPGVPGARRLDNADYIYFGNKGSIEINQKGEL